MNVSTVIEHLRVDARLSADVRIFRIRSLAAGRSNRQANAKRDCSRLQITRDDRLSALDSDRCRIHSCARHAQVRKNNSCSAISDISHFSHYCSKDTCKA
jgi:hypothetical protein